MQHYLDQILHPKLSARVGAAIWTYLWLVQNITEDGPDCGLVAGGQCVTVPAIAKAVGLGADAVRDHLDKLDDLRVVRRIRASHGYRYEIPRFHVLEDGYVVYQLHDVGKRPHHHMTTSPDDHITTSVPSPGSSPEVSPLSPLHSPDPSPLPSPQPPTPATKQAVERERDEGPLGPRWAWAIATGVAARDQPDKVLQALKACEPVSLIDGVLTVRLPANQGQAAMVNGVRQRAVNALRMDKKNPIELNLIRAGPGSETEARAGP